LKFINFSNHPANTWQAEQLNAAMILSSSIEDMEFPAVDPDFSSEQVRLMAEEAASKILLKDPAFVHIMGEMTFCYAVITVLKSAGIRCLASTSERVTYADEAGRKTSVFRFIKFREYP
jgi:hypothetical protein